MNKTSKYKLPEDVIKRLAQWSSGFLSADELDRIVLTFERELNKYHVTRENESNLIRIFNSVFDKVSFLTDCLKYPHHPEIICSVAVNSNYLTDIIVRNPELMYQIFSPDYLKKKISIDLILNEIGEGINRFKSLESKIKFLRNTKRRYLLKIALNDISGNISLEEIVGNLSSLAIAVNRSLFDLCLMEVSASLNVDPGSHKYALMSLGKLGGNELNYSSDIDLLLIYDSNELLGKSSRIEYHEVLIKATNLFISKATEFTELGNLYRVDFRLRPDGGIAPLCRTLLDTMNYYESRGELWERQMLIKLNFLGGSLDLYNQFNSFVKAYVYQVSKASPLVAIKEMKEAIERHHSDKNNIKTTAGGIRDIEFTIQALQLVNGNRMKELRTPNTITAISTLEKLQLLTADESKTLREAYIYYRRIEHYLQLMNNTQTHTIPEITELRKSLSVYMGSGTEKELFKLLNGHKKNVRNIYDSIVAVSGSGKKKEVRIDQLNFHDKKRAERNLKFLEFGTGLVSTKNFDSRTTRHFTSIKPSLLKLLNETFNPDHVLDNFVKMVQSYKFPALLYEELTNEKFFKQILRICERSNLAINQLINEPQLVEDLISRSAFAKNLTDYIDTTSFERYKFALAVQFSLNLIDYSKVSELITQYISAILQKNFEEFFGKYNLFVAGLGSYGSMEMTFFSDLDLIIVIDDIRNNSDVQTSAQKYVKRSREFLHSLEIDFRLRPEGKSSPLVWDIGNYEKYLESRAGLWEFQSLFKMRKSAGSDELCTRFKQIVINKLAKFDPEVIAKDITDMHSKVTAQSSSVLSKSIDLKRSPGGLTTLDYYLAYYQLTNEYFYQYAGKPDYSKKLIIRKANNVIPDINAVKLNYGYLKDLEFILQNSFEQRKALVPNDNIKQSLLIKFTRETDSRGLEQKLLSILKENINLLKSISR